MRTTARTRLDDFRTHLNRAVTAMLWTLDNALGCSRYHNLLHRHCDLVHIANRSGLINSFVAHSRRSLHSLLGLARIERGRLP